MRGPTTTARVLVVGLLIHACLAWSASTAQAGPHLRAHVGLVHSYLTGGDEDASDSRDALGFGGQVSWPLGHLTDLQTGLGYAPRGGVFRDQGSWGSSLMWVDEARFEVDYLEVPLQLHISPMPRDDRFRIGMYFGVAWRFVLSSHAEIDGQTLDDWDPGSELAYILGNTFALKLGSVELALETLLCRLASEVPDAGADLGYVRAADIRLAVTF